VRERGYYVKDGGCGVGVGCKYALKICIRFLANFFKSQYVLRFQENQDFFVQYVLEFFGLISQI
jgi:hypothetical protein